MKKWMKIIIGIISVPFLVILLFVSYYLINNLQGITDTYEAGNPEAEIRILIATQGSEFKERLVDHLINELNDKKRYFYVTDCTKMDKEKLKLWDACIIIHTTQIHGMPKASEVFLANSKDLSNVILVSTSGGGDEAVQNFDVDGISTASRMSRIPEIVKDVVNKIEMILNNKS